MRARVLEMAVADKFELDDDEYTLIRLIVSKI